MHRLGQQIGVFVAHGRARVEVGVERRDPGGAGDERQAFRRLHGEGARPRHAFGHERVAGLAAQGDDADAAGHGGVRLAHGRHGERHRRRVGAPLDDHVDAGDDAAGIDRLHVARRQAGGAEDRPVELRQRDVGLDVDDHAPAAQVLDAADAAIGLDHIGVGQDPDPRQRPHLAGGGVEGLLAVEGEARVEARIQPHRELALFHQRQIDRRTGMGLRGRADGEPFLEQLGEAAAQQEVGRARRVGADRDSLELRLGRTPDRDRRGQRGREKDCPSHMCSPFQAGRRVRGDGFAAGAAAPRGR